MDMRRSAPAIYASAFRLFWSNPVLCVPAGVALISLFAFAAIAALVPKNYYPAFAVFVLVVMIVEGVAAVVWLLRMCAAAWKSGHVSLSDGEEPAYVWVTDVLAIVLIGLVWSVVDAGIRLFAGAATPWPSTPAAALGLVLLVVLNLLLLYIPVSIVAGRNGPMDAARESAQLTTHHFGRTLLFGVVLTIGMFPFWANGGEPPVNTFVLALEFIWIALFGTYMLSVLTGQYVALRTTAAGTPVSS